MMMNEKGSKKKGIDGSKNITNNLSKKALEKPFY